MKYRLILLLTLLLPACSWRTPGSQPSRWTYADLRVLSAPNLTEPAADMVALYTRITDSDVQVRIDFLDLDFQTDYDLYLILDVRPGGAQALPLNASPGLEWDALVFLPAAGQPQLFDADPLTGLPDRDANIVPRLVRDPWNDTLVVSLNRNLILARQGAGATDGATVDLSPQPFGVQAFLTRAGSSVLIDQLGPARSDGLPAPRAAVLLAFWNTFPAYTPAQALRRWDGAHTGPFGGRHGLGPLLAAARHAKVPLALLDLKLPAALSALDYTGALPVIQRMQSKDLLILPEAVPGYPVYSPAAGAASYSESPDPASMTSFAGAFAIPDNLAGLAAGYSRRVAQGFGLSPSRMLYTPRLPAEPPPGYPLIFSPVDAPGPIRWRDRTVIPLPLAGSDLQATPEGLSLDIRRRLLSDATSKDERHQLLILGGSLPSSAWGEPQSAEASMAYIASHPWIQPLDDQDLLGRSFDTKGGSAAGFVSTTAKPGTLILAPAGLSDSPFPESGPAANPLDRAAWDAYLALFASLPPNPPQLPELRSLYAGEIAPLLAAARWAEAPQPQAACQSDSNRDGGFRCILASADYFAVFETRGARLVYLFTRDVTSAGEAAIHQLVAPTSQFLAGLGDPSDWDLSAGTAADPGGIIGAFSDAQHTWEAYQPSVEPDRIRFTSLDGSIQKTFTFSGSGLRVNYHSPDAVQVHILLALDPWRRFSPGWGDQYFGGKTGDGWSWRIESGPGVEIQSSGRISAAAFTDSHALLSQVEDPNYDYPPGHYLPFPVALVNVYGEGDFYIQMNFVGGVEG